MKAVFFEQLGGAEVLKFGDFPTPEPQSGEVLVRVKACGVNHIDIWLRHRENISLPHIPGSDVSGVIEGIRGTSSLRVGDEVVINPAIPCGQCPRCRLEEPCEQVKILGSAVPGGYAEYVTLPVQQVYLKPKKLSFVEAAAFPLTFLTAWHMLVGRAGAKKGETIYIWGASGSLGSAAIQVAQYLGLRIIAAARSQESAEKIQQIGAHNTVVYPKEKVVARVKELTDGNGVDVVFESVGEKTWDQSLKMLRPHGRLVIAGTTSGNEVSTDLSDLYVRQLSVLGARMGTPQEFESVLRLFEQGELKPVIDKVFPLSEAAKAQARMEHGEHFGKIVLEVS